MTDRERFEAYLAAEAHPRAGDARALWRRAADALPSLPPPTAGKNGDGHYYFDWSYTYAKGITLSVTFPTAGGVDWFYRDKAVKVVIGTEEDSDPSLPEYVFALLRAFALANELDRERERADHDEATLTASKQRWDADRTALEAEATKLRRELDVTQGWLDRFQGDAAANGLKAWQLEKGTRALVATLPKCDGLNAPGVTEACDRPATNAFERGGGRWCDEHRRRDQGGTPADDYPRAPALRALVALLGVPGPADAASELLAAVTRAAELVGCGDSSCRFERPHGMATNGGCRCLNKPFVGAALARLFKAAASAVGFEQGREG